MNMYCGPEDQEVTHRGWNLHREIDEEPHEVRKNMWSIKKGDQHHGIAGPSYKYISAKKFIEEVDRIEAKIKQEKSLWHKLKRLMRLNQNLKVG